MKGSHAITASTARPLSYDVSSADPEGCLTSAIRLFDRRTTCRLSSLRRRISSSSGRVRPRGSRCTSTRPGRRRTARCPPTCTASSPPTSRWPPIRRCSRRSRAAPSSCSTSSTMPARTARGATAMRRRVRAAPGGGSPCRARRSGPTRARSRSSRYDGDQAVPDFEYGYGEALDDRRVVRPVYFPRINGQMEWTAPDGAIHAATLRRSARRARWRASGCAPRCRSRAMAARGPRAANAQLDRCAPARSPTRRGLVIATDQEHARGIARILRLELRTCGAARDLRRPGRVGRDRRFAAGTDPGSSPCGWSPKASTSRGCASASTRRRPRPSSSSARRSAGSCAGRAACRASAPGCSSPTTRGCGRTRPASPSSAATRCAATSASDEEPPVEEQRDRGRRGADVALRRHLGGRDRPGRACRPRDGTSSTSSTTERTTGSSSTLAPPPPLSGGRTADVEGAPTRRDEKRLLRDENARLARDLARRTGLTHAEVNAELNRRSGLRRVSEATVAQLESRLVAAERWAETA